MSGSDGTPVPDPEAIAKLERVIGGLVASHLAVNKVLRSIVEAKA
jgi:hypothetical protein